MINLLLGLFNKLFGKIKEEEFYIVEDMHMISNDNISVKPTTISDDIGIGSAL
jgi:hypothetical protein